MFEGVLPAMVTPFNEDGSVDNDSLDKLVDYLLESGVNGLVTCGTTGESSSLTPMERMEINRRVVNRVNSIVPVIAGVGTNLTSTTVSLAQDAEKIGVDGLLVITPYYNKPTPEGLYKHFCAVANSTKLPIIVYNVPSRTGVNLDTQTLEKLAHHPGITGLKEASGSLDQVTSFIRICGTNVGVLSGDDALTYPIMCVGGNGVISVSANIIPEKLCLMMKSITIGDFKTAKNTHLELYPLHKALFLETNPIPVKTVLSWMGLVKPVFRLPLVPMSKENQDLMKKILADFKILGNE